jgi:hypothetical protein
MVLLLLLKGMWCCHGAKDIFGKRENATQKKFLTPWQQTAAQTPK